MARAADVIYPWERQPRETEKAYEAFLRFKNFGPGRSLIETARALEKSYRHIKRWAKEWDWKNRATLFDRDVERKAKAAAEKEQKAMIARHIGIGLKVQEKALQGLEKLNPERMGAVSVQSLLDFGTKLERDSRTITAQAAAAEQDAANILASVLEKAWGIKGETEGDGEP